LIGQGITSAQGLGRMVSQPQRVTASDGQMPDCSAAPERRGRGNEVAELGLPLSKPSLAFAGGHQNRDGAQDGVEPRWQSAWIVG
jgi:hypothetical protein